MAPFLKIPSRNPFRSLTVAAIAALAVALTVPAGIAGGQEQGGAIARALVSDPTILICDEPTGDLDRKTADEILGLLQVLNREHGKTIVMVTHDPKAAEFARRTLHLEKGQLLEQAAA